MSADKRDRTHTHLEVRPAGPKGRGVFALAPIAAGSRVLEFGGEQLTTADLSDDHLALQIGPDLWLCSDGSLMDDAVNHSCAPNVGFLDGEPVLHALRDIDASEELCWDYSTSIAIPGWSLECQCGAPQCRGVILPWGELAEVDRARLREHSLGYLREL